MNQLLTNGFVEMTDELNMVKDNWWQRITRLYSIGTSTISYPTKNLSGVPQYTFFAADTAQKQQQTAWRGSQLQFNEKISKQKEILETPAAAAAPSNAGKEFDRITDVGIDIIVNQSIDSIPLTPPYIIWRHCTTITIIQNSGQGEEKAVENERRRKGFLRKAFSNPL